MNTGCVVAKANIKLEEGVMPLDIPPTAVLASVGRGYADVWDTVMRARHNQRLGSVFLLTGPCGVGKKAAAWILATWLMTGIVDIAAVVNEFCTLARFKTSENDHENGVGGAGRGNGLMTAVECFQAMAGGVHPDFLILPARASAAEVRQGLERLYQTRWDHCPRVVVLTRIDDWHPASSNALLKMLEEPPENTFFLMTCTGQPLATVASRARVLRLNPLTDAVLRQVLTEAVSVRGETEDVFLTAQDSSIQWVGGMEDFLWLAQGCVARAWYLIQQGPWVQETLQHLSHWKKGFAHAIVPHLWAGQTAECWQAWQEIVAVWWAKEACASGAGALWDDAYADMVRMMNDVTVFHTDPVLTLHAICAKISGFFQIRHHV